jgi:serine protease inhibitor
VLEVDEEGTVAAAATAGPVPAGMALPPKTVMRVNHPFFLAIRDNVTGTMLFEGVIQDPQ